MKISPRILVQVVIFFLALFALFLSTCLLMRDSRMAISVFMIGVCLIILVYHYFLFQWYCGFLELREKKRVTDRLAYAGTMAGALAHEIRSPLSTVLLNLQLIEEDLKEDPGKLEVSRILKKIDRLQTETRRLEDILDTFLGIARGEKLEISEVDFNDLIEEILSLHKPELARKGIRVLEHLGEGNTICRIDRNLLKESITNLLVNARQAMEPLGEGELIVKTRLEKKGVSLEIIDTGPGIPLENLKKMGQLYFTTKKNGSGLGLARSKRIIEQHHGRLKVESQVGKGTSVTVFLPYGKQD